MANKLPYGYLVSEADNSVWYIDEEVAANVQEIYARIIGGEDPTAIARSFNARGLDNPTTHHYKLKGMEAP